MRKGNRGAHSGKTNSLANHRNPTAQDRALSASLVTWTSLWGNQAHANDGKRDLLRVSLILDDQYSEAYSGLALSTVLRKFKTDCKAIEAPDHQRLSVIQVMFLGNALQYFNADDAFHEIKEQLMTPAHRATFTTEWNTLPFKKMKRTEAEKTAA